MGFLVTKRLKAVVIRELFEMRETRINNVSLLNAFPSCAWLYERGGAVFSHPATSLRRKIKVAFEAAAYQKFVPLPNNFTLDLSGRRAAIDLCERKLSRTLRYESSCNLCSLLICIKK